FHNNKDLAKADEWILAALAKSPKNPRFGLLRARILDKAGKRAEALKVIAEANTWARESNNANYVEQNQLFYDSIKSHVIDLRSDTVTKPTDAMRQAMANAEVGDDVYGEDPTINRLQERAAEIFEKEAALFVSTGSMGNQIAVKFHTRPGDEVIIEERGHIFNYEMGTPAAIS